MAQENRAQIKTYFETGDVPTETQFANSFDSQVFWVDDVETDLTSNSDSKVPTVKAVVDGIAAITGQLTSDELDAIQGSSLPSASNVFVTESAQTFTKDANDNVFYNGVTATLGTGCAQNTFYQSSTTLVFGDGCKKNIVQISCSDITLGDNCEQNTFEQGAISIIFGDNLRRTLVRSGDYASLDLTASPTFAFLYSLAYPSEIYLGSDGQPYHRYYDGANNRDVITLLVSPYTVSYIGGGSTVTDFTDLGDVPSSYTGQANKVVSVKNDESGLEFTTPTSGISLTTYLAQSGTVTASATSGINAYFFTGSGSLVLPTAVGNTAIFKVKNSHTANITVTFTSGQNADGTTTITLIPNQALEFISNNVNYNIF